MLEFKIENITDGIVVDINFNKQKIGELRLVKYELEDDYYTISGSRISPEFQGKGFYQKAIIEVLNKENITIRSIFRSTAAEHAWDALLKKYSSILKITKREHPEEKTTEILISKR